MQFANITWNTHNIRIGKNREHKNIKGQPLWILLKIQNGVYKLQVMWECMYKPNLRNILPAMWEIQVRKESADGWKTGWTAEQNGGKTLVCLLPALQAEATNNWLWPEYKNYTYTLYAKYWVWTSKTEVSMVTMTNLLKLQKSSI